VLGTVPAHPCPIKLPAFTAELPRGMGGRRLRPNNTEEINTLIPVFLKSPDGYQFFFLGIPPVHFKALLPVVFLFS